MFNSDGYFNIFTIGKEIKRQKIIFVAIVLGCVLAAYLVSVMLPPKYEAQVTLLPMSQEGESDAVAGLNFVSSLLGNNSAASADRPSWLEAVILMQTRNFAKNFIETHNLMQMLIDEHGMDVVWDELSDNEKTRRLNILARRWISKNIELEQDQLTNTYQLNVFLSDEDKVVELAMEYVKDINAYMKEFLIRENEHKIEFYRNRIAEEQVSDIKASMVGLMSVAIQKRALIDTRDEIVLRTIDPAAISVLSFPILTLNLAVGIFLGLILALIVVLFIQAYNRYLQTKSTY